MKERLKNNIAILKQHNLTHEPVYHITDGKKYEVGLIDEIVKDCEKIIKDEEQGLIVRLPCKVGDSCYFVTKVEEDFELLYGYVKSISIEKDNIWLGCVYKGGLSYWHTSKDKELFFNFTEAEKKLAELKGEEK